MSRLLSTVLVVVLLGGTAAAFALTEGLKLERTPVSGTRVDKVFSPVCGCDRDRAHIRFRLRRADAIRLGIVDGSGAVVRTLVAGRRFGRGFHTFTWNGRGDTGRLLPDGEYRPRVHLDRAHRTIVLPNPIALDTRPPQVKLLYVRPRVFSPDGNRRADLVAVGYRLSEPANGILLVNGRRQVLTRFRKERWQIEWYGKIDGRPLSAGTYRVAVAAVDVAGNRSRPTRAVAVRVRYVELARREIRVRARTRFAVGVSTDARSYRYLFAGRRGLVHGSLLHLRAPKAGRYRLYVEVAGHADRAVVIVRPRR